MGDVVVYEERRDFLMSRPDIMVGEATRLATILRDIIKKQGLSMKIGQGEHVLADGWATLGSLLGVLPKENRVVEHEDGSCEAHVDLVSVSTGRVVGGGSGYVGMDEPTWKNRPKFARRSMAITRATGKAYRLSFSWIIKLAGYESTPAEEMIDTGKGNNDETFKQQGQSRPTQSDASKSAGDYKITANQIKRLYAIAKSKNWSQEEVKKVALQAFGVTSFNDLKKDDYDTLIKTIETKSPNEALASAAEFTDNVPEVGELPF